MATTLALQSAPCSVFTRISDISSSSQASQPAPTAAAAAEEDQQQQQQQLAWTSRALTLTNLRRLARTLNPSDAELAPVQVWFEVASLYGFEIATNGTVLDRLKLELAGKARCVVYGAAVRRNVFEDALMKVFGFLPRTWAGSAGGAGPGTADLHEEEEMDDDTMMMLMMMDMADKEDYEEEEDEYEEMAVGINGMEMGIGGGEASMSAMYEDPKGAD